MRTPPGVRALDGALVAAVFLLGLAGHVAARDDADVEAAPLGVGIVVCAAAAAALLAWRRRRPLAVLAGLVVVTVVAAGVDEPGLFSGQVGVELVVACFAIGAWSTHLRVALAATGLLMVLL